MGAVEDYINELIVEALLEQAWEDSRLIGPELPGVLSWGTKPQVRVAPQEIT
jgi:hypothetical protein